MITVTDSQGCVSWVLLFFFFSPPLEYSAYIMESFFMRYHVLETHIDSAWEFTWVDYRAGKDILLSEHPSLDLTSGGAEGRLYESNRTCGWCIKWIGEACFT